jgi:hypothetical protein
MDKKLLKDVLTGLTNGQEVEVTFRGDKNSLNGRYRVLESKTDRGKMGSRKAELESLTDATVKVKLHTRDNNEVLNLVIDGTMHGSADESSEPRNYAKDEARGRDLKLLFKTFSEGNRVTVKSDLEPSFNGTFTVKETRASRGKGGQQILVLTDGTNEIQLWSYRHSLAITSIELAA